jgi:hypothetical protein
MKDQELEQLMRNYEAEVAAYRRLPQAEPTALLDRAILTKARAAIAHAPPVRSRPPRWMAMAASFAGVAIAAGIGWRVYEARRDEAVSASDRSAPAAAAPRESAFEVEVVPDRRRERGLDMAQLPAPPPPPAAPAPEPQAFDARARAQQEAVTAAAPVVSEPPPAAQKAIVPDPHQRSDHGGAAALPERRQNLAAPAAASAPAPMATEALGAVSAEAERDRDAAQAGTRRKEEVESPQAWLARIRQLVRDRRYTEARTELYRFRTRHPEAVIPPDLRRYAP